MNCLFWASLCLLDENLYRASRMGWLRILGQLEKQDHQGTKAAEEAYPTWLELEDKTRISRSEAGLIWNKEDHEKTRYQ